MAEEKKLLNDSELENVSAGITWKRTVYVWPGPVEIRIKGSGTMDDYRKAMEQCKELVAATEAIVQKK